MIDELHKLIRAGSVKEALEYIDKVSPSVLLLKDKWGYRADTLALARGYVEIVDAITNKTTRGVQNESVQ